MDISVTVPVYNVEKYLARCLNSILGQSFTGDFEVICVDDGSTDKSIEILEHFKEKYPDKIKIYLQNHQGLSSARNTALEHTTGKYTMFVDSDDFIEKRALEELYNYAESHNADVVIFDYLCGTEGVKEVMRQHFKNIADKYGDTSFNVETADPMVYRYVPVATWIKIYRTDLIRDLKFEFDLNNQDVPHWDLVYTKAKNVYYYPKPLYFYTKRREDAITQTTGVKAFDVFRAFSLSENILRESGYFERFKTIHYAHFTCNLINRMQQIKPELRREFVEMIKKYPMELDYDEFDKEDFYQFEKDTMKIIRFIKENSFEATDQLMKNKKIWV